MFLQILDASLEFMGFASRIDMFKRQVESGKKKIWQFCLAQTQNRIAIKSEFLTHAYS